MPPLEPTSDGATNPRSRGFTQVLVGALAIASLMIVSWIFPVIEWLNAFNDWVAGLGWLGVGIFIAVYVLATVLVVPGSALTLGAGFAFGLATAFFAVMAGSVVGAAAAFLIARHFAREAVTQRFGNDQRFVAIDRAVGREGAKIVFLLRLSPAFPFNALNYLLGLTAVGFWRYVLASWIGMMPGTLLFVYLGYAGKTGLEAAAGGDDGNVLRYVYLGFGLLATLAVTIYVTRLARQALRKHAGDAAGTESDRTTA